MISCRCWSPSAKKRSHRCWFSFMAWLLPIFFRGMRFHPPQRWVKCQWSSQRFASVDWCKSRRNWWKLAGASSQTGWVFHGFPADLQQNQREKWSHLEPVVISNRIVLVCRSHSRTQECLWTRLPFSRRKRVVVAGIRLQDYSYFAPLLAGQHLISTGLSDSLTEVRSNSLIDWDGNKYPTFMWVTQ